MTPTTPARGIHRTYLAVLAGAALVAGFAVAFSAMLAGTSSAAATAPPVNRGEPQVSGTTRVGEVLRTTRGTWISLDQIRFTYRWYRCDGRGQPNASDCGRISNADNATYVLRAADAGFRIRAQVVATNSDGSTVATSNPTPEITSAVPVNTTAPTISGSPVLGNRLTASPGEWTGVRPMGFAFQWLRCNTQGESCAVVSGATDNNYVPVEQDLGRTLRVRVTAENAQGRTAKRSAATAAVTRNTPPAPPAGSTISVTDVPATARLIVSEVRFSPNPVTSRTDPITVRIRVKDTRGYVIRGALVFVRATPRVTSGGDRQATGDDGWVTYQLVPNANFPQPRSGFNVQFFVKAYRAGDPALAGVAGYRLVQVRLAG
jgi:hypothetical protein